MTSPPDPSPDITGALALLREALRAPVPPKPIIEFALDACAAAGFPPTTPELDDKLRALGLLFGVAAPTPAHLTHFLWHILDGNIPLAITRQAMESLDKLEFKGEFKGLAGEQTRKVLEVIGADLGAVYGDSLVKNLAVIVRAVARKAVEMTTAEWEEACHVARAEKIEAVKALAAAGGSNLGGELAAVRSEAAGLRQTQALLEADLTLICEASGLTTAKDVAGCIKDQYEALALIRQAYNAALGRGPSVGATAEEVAEHITALTGSDKALAHDDIKGKYQTLAAAVCPFPKEHDKLVKQAAAARDRALIECSAALPDGYRLEHATPDGGPCGYRWTTRVDTWGVTARGPGVAVRQAWQRLVGQQQTAHREAVRHAEKRLAELDGPVPIRSVLLAALEALGWTAAAGDPEDWAIREGAKLATDRKALSDLRSIMADAEKREAVLVKERATLIGDLQDIALEVDPSLGGEALLERIRQIVHDAAACEQHRRQVDAIDADLGRVIGERGEGLTLESRLAELVEQRDMYRKAAEPVLSSDGPQPGPDPHGMQRIRDLLHERRVRLAVRDGEACSWPELVRGLLDDFHTAEADEQYLRGLIDEQQAAIAGLQAQLAGQPRAADLRAAAESLAGKGSAADHVRAGWEGTTKYGGPGQPLIDPAALTRACGYPPPMEHPGVLALTISAPDALAGMVAKPSLALWYRFGDKTWCLAQQEVEPMRWGDTFLLTIPLGPK
jgi:hypothetical protein